MSYPHIFIKKRKREQCESLPLCPILPTGVWLCIPILKRFSRCYYSLQYNYLFHLFFSIFLFLLSCSSHFLFYLILFLINFRIQIFFLNWLLLPRASMPYSPPGLWFGGWQSPALIYCWWRGWAVAAVLWVPSRVISQNHTKALPQQGLLLTNPSSPFSSPLKREN